MDQEKYLKSIDRSLKVIAYELSRMTRECTGGDKETKTYKGQKTGVSFES